MRPREHALISAAIAGLSFLSTKSASVAAATFLAGFAIDADHLIDYSAYLLTSGVRSTKAAKFSDGSFYRHWGKFGILFHSYELLLPLWAFASISGNIALASWVSLSFVTHLILDQLSYPLHPLIYFFTFRLKKGFQFDSLVSPQGRKNRW